jgi:hypothetical protein
MACFIIIIKRSFIKYVFRIEICIKDFLKIKIKVKNIRDKKSLNSFNKSKFRF